MFSELKKDDLIVLDGYHPTQDIKSPPPNVGSCVIKDSGERREFETGAVRDIQEGKGRCDLLPLDVVADILQPHCNTYDLAMSEVFNSISEYQNTGKEDYLTAALIYFSPNAPTPPVEGVSSIDRTYYSMFLEVSKHFEEGAKKYGEYNWQKGIPTHCYIDSAVRHYLKYLRGDTDEPHDRAFVWNILCCIWTCKHKPELNDYAKEATDDETT